MTIVQRSWHHDPGVEALLSYRDHILGPDDEIRPDDPKNGTAFERAGHCKGIGEGTRAYNLAVSYEKATQVCAPAAQGKGKIGELAEGVQLRQGALRVCPYPCSRLSVDNTHPFHLSMPLASG